MRASTTVTLFNLLKTPPNVFCSHSPGCNIRRHYIRIQVNRCAMQCNNNRGVIYDGYSNICLTNGSWCFFFTIFTCREWLRCKFILYVRSLHPYTRFSCEKNILKKKHYLYKHGWEYVYTKMIQRVLYSNMILRWWRIYQEN